MSREAIFYPMAAMVLLVAVVMSLMLRERIREMKARRIHPSRVASSSQMAAVLQDTRGADNFRNLFEMPVLFHALCLALYASGQTTPLMLGAAWAYVALRYAHSFIHIGYNRVEHRFLVFAASALLLVLMWLGLVLQLAGRG
jgi:hypothetical protein